MPQVVKARFVPEVVRSPYPNEFAHTPKMYSSSLAANATPSNCGEDEVGICKLLMTEQYSFQVRSDSDVPAGTDTSIYCNRGIIKVDIRPFERKSLAYPATRGV